MGLNTKEEPRFDSVTSFAMACDESSTPQEIRAIEAESILANWCNVATYHMSRAEVIAMLTKQADRLR